MPTFLQQGGNYRSLRVNGVAICRCHNESAFYRSIASDVRRGDESLANIAIILIHQSDVMLAKLQKRQQKDFLEQGGIREQMTRARLQYRSSQSTQSSQSSPKKNNTNE